MMILIPLKPFLTPRKFHTVVVFLCRMFGCPVLLTISFFERYVVGPFDKDRNSVGNSLKLTVANSLGGLALTHFNVIMKGNGSPPSSGRRLTTMSKMSSRISRNLRKFGGLAVINACFDYDPYPPARNEAEAQLAEDQLAVLREREVSVDRVPQQPGEPDNNTVRRKADLMQQSSSKAGEASGKPVLGSSDLENGTRGTIRQAASTAGPPEDVGGQLKTRMNPSSSSGTGYNPIGVAPERELTTLEKLFLSHAGIVSTFVGPVPVDTSETTGAATVMPTAATTPPTPMASRLGRGGDSAGPNRDGTGSDGSNSSTIEEDRSRPTSERPPCARVSRPSTVYLDPPRTSLGGNHKPASIIQDEFEEDRLERRRHRRRRNRQLNSSPSSLSALHLATRSSSHSLHDDHHTPSEEDEDEDDDDDDEDYDDTQLEGHHSRGKKARDRLVLVSMHDLENLLQSHFDKLESKIRTSLAEHITVASAPSSSANRSPSAPSPIPPPHLALSRSASGSTGRRS